MQGLGGEVVLVAQFRPWAQQQFLNGLAEKRYCSHHNPGNESANTTKQQRVCHCPFPTVPSGRSELAKLYSLAER
jgi:hypothetical protein